MNGTIKNTTPKRAFGFIKGEDGIEYFFHRDDFNGHWEDLTDDLANKNIIHVTFLPQAGTKGPRAGNVSRNDWPNQAPS